MRKALVVDDNSLLVYFTAKNLERDIQGLQVITATSCKEARIEAAENNFEVLVVDYGLGDGNGLDLIAELSAERPGIKSILISGQVIPEAGRSDVFASVQKPYEAFTLAELVGRALEEAGPESMLEISQRQVSCSGYDRHKVENHLGSLLAGLRALGKDLQSCANDPEAVAALTDEYLDRLCGLVVDVSSLLPDCPKNRGDDG